MKINITNFRNNTLKFFGSKTVKNRKANTLNVNMNRNVSNQISSFLEGPSSRHFLKKKSRKWETKWGSFFVCVVVCLSAQERRTAARVYIFGCSIGRPRETSGWSLHFLLCLRGVVEECRWPAGSPCVCWAAAAASWRIFTCCYLPLVGRFSFYSVIIYGPVVSEEACRDFLYFLQNNSTENLISLFGLLGDSCRLVKRFSAQCAPWRKWLLGLYIFNEFHFILYRSIALEVLYTFAIGTKMIGWFVRLLEIDELRRARCNFSPASTLKIICELTFHWIVLVSKDFR